MLLLRLARGIEFGFFAEMSELDARVIYADEFKQLASLGLIEVRSQRVVLTERGIDVGDAIAREFLLE